MRPQGFPGVRWIVVGMGLAIGWAVQAQETQPHETRTFDLVPQAAERMAAPPDAAESDAPSPSPFSCDWDAVKGEAALRDWFGRLGVTWPEGSSLRFHPTLLTLEVRSTPAVLDAVACVLAEQDALAVQVEVQLDFVEFDRDAINVLARERRIAGSTLQELWRQGRGRLVQSPRCVGDIRGEQELKARTEVLFPVDFGRLYGCARGDVGETDDNAFETHETGLLLKATPKLLPGGRLIELEVHSEWVGTPSWKDFGATITYADGTVDKLPMPQPFFPSDRINTTLIVADSVPVLLEGGVTDFIAAKPQYVFVTARRVDRSGRPVLLARTQAIEPPSLAAEARPASLDGGAADAPAGEDAMRVAVFLVDTNLAQRVEASGKPGVLEFLADLGLKCPEGSHARFSEHGDAVIARSSLAGLAELELYLAPLCQFSVFGIEAQLEVVEYDMEDIDRLARERNLDIQSLRDLFRAGRARLLEAPTLTTRSESEATWKTVTEYLYPTSFAGTVPGSGLAPNVVPGDFETREVGSILNFCAHVTPDGRTVRFDGWVSRHMAVGTTEWRDYGSRQVKPGGEVVTGSMPQPFFSATAPSISAEIANGATMLCWGGVTMARPGKVVHVFVTPRARQTVSPSARWRRTSARPQDRPQASGNDDAIETRRFVVGPELVEYYRKEGYGTVGEWFEAWGLGGPKGSFVEHRPSERGLRVRNTHANLRQISAILGRAGLRLLQIETQVDYVDFPLEDIERLAREESLSGESLLKLWKEGQGRLRHTLRSVVREDQESSVARAVETRYPTAFESARADVMIAGEGKAELGIVTPGGFEVREVGAILQVVPWVSRDGDWIHLTLAPQVVGEPEWKDYGRPRGITAGARVEQAMPQPFFPVVSVATSCDVADGDTVLLGGGAKGEEEQGRVVYAFLTARSVDPEGEPLR